VYKPPAKNIRRGGARVYSMPDVDKKSTEKLNHMAYRSGDSFLETRQARWLMLILVLFLVGVFFVSVYFGWIPFFGD
jgi:hypothetical protein